MEALTRGLNERGAYDPREGRDGTRLRVSTFAQTPDRLGRKRTGIDTLSQSVRSSIQPAEPDPIWVSGTRSEIGRKETPCRFLRCLLANHFGACSMASLLE